MFFFFLRGTIPVCFNTVIQCFNLSSRYLSIIWDLMVLGFVLGIRMLNDNSKWLRKIESYLLAWCRRCGYFICFFQISVGSFITSNRNIWMLSFDRSVNFFCNLRAFEISTKGVWNAIFQSKVMGFKFWEPFIVFLE